ncbi:aromatic acid exporter family protein [Alkalibacterium sp. MB6]|uniref:aromatic acid exporter family protein n=1 Tax=Alkalibacterium sp. MB6 TaxID=2081965 RepID=UPI00137A0323|nr:aromatic acid exporter family protein [Alkalibacterium sp. MB6]
MNVSERTFKIAVSAVLASLIAQWIRLQNPLAAGIIAVLSVLDTKKESLSTAVSRVLSTLIAFVIATVIFYFLGFTLLAFGLYLTIYVPVAYRFKLESGIAPCSVLVTHFMIAESFAWQWQINGLLLMAIGASMAILFNLWTPSREVKMNKKISELEEYMRIILRLFSEQLNGVDRRSKLRETIKLANQLVEKIRSLAFHEYDNQLFNRSDYYIRYSQMRIRQLDLLKSMSHNVSVLNLQTDQNQRLAELFLHASEQFHEKNTGIELLDKIGKLYNYYRKSPLPETREEFESRAVMYQLLHDVEQLIRFKRDFFKD